MTTMWPAGAAVAIPHRLYRSKVLDPDCVPLRYTQRGPDATATAEARRHPSDRVAIASPRCTRLLGGKGGDMDGAEGPVNRAEHGAAGGRHNSSTVLP